MEKDKKIKFATQVNAKVLDELKELASKEGRQIQSLVDGNKRAAFAVCFIFLDINACLLDADSDWLYERMMVWIKEKENRLQHITADLRLCVKMQA